MCSGWFAAVLLLLDVLIAWRDTVAQAQGGVALAAARPDLIALLSKAMNIPWLGPGLAIAVLLLLTLRGTRRAARKPLVRLVHRPRLERYRGVLPRRHEDLEL